MLPGPLTYPGDPISHWRSHGACNLTSKSLKS
jgi:hypothetical protein